jgi:hypothetical protein
MAPTGLGGHSDNLLDYDGSGRRSHFLSYSNRGSDPRGGALPLLLVSGVEDTKGLIIRGLFAELDELTESNGIINAIFGTLTTTTQLHQS